MATSTEEEQEQLLNEYSIALLPYYHLYMERASTIGDPKDCLHPKNTRQMGKRIRQIRKSCGLSLQELCETTGLETVQVAALESGMISFSDLSSGGRRALLTLLQVQLEKRKPSNLHL